MSLQKKFMLAACCTLTLVFAASLHSQAQAVYSAKYSSDADVKVYVAQYKSDADLVVYKAKYKSDVDGNKGIWFFTDYASDAKKKIFFTEYKSDAQLIIYFSEYKSDAGWQNKSKQQLMY